MSIGSLLPWVAAQWFTDAGDAVLSGGRVYFYAVGTTTPKAVYQDYQRLATHAQPVVLSASGHATIFLGDGGYKVVLTDESGAVIDTKDGIFGSTGGIGSGSNATLSIYKLYSDLRAATDAPDVAYVCGRTTEGDGGAGLFQLIPGSSAPDDDGVYLVANGGASVYKRIFDESINPEWYGVKYDIAADQSARLSAALAASVYLSFPVLVTRQVYLAANISVTIGASLRTNEDGYFSSPSSVTMDFQTGSTFSSTGSPFRSAVQPTFLAGTIDALRLSWFGGNWARCLASTSAKFPLWMDVSTSLTSDLIIPANLAFEPVGGAVVTFGGFANLSIASLNYAGMAQFVAWTLDSYVGSVNIGSQFSYLEWFGGSPTNTGNQNAIPFRACLFTEHIDLVPNKTYTVTSSNAIAFSNSNTARFNGHGGSLVLNQNVAITVAETNDITISGSGTFNLSAAIFNQSTIIIKTIGGAKSARNSQLFDVNKIVQSNDSTIYGGLVEIGGKLDNCTITLPGTVQVNAGYTFNNCTFGKSESQHAPAFSFPTDPTHATFSGCSFDIDGAIFYSENEDLAVDLIACTDSDNWSKGIHNGYAAVNLVGCNCRGNSTATTVDGVGQQLFDPVISTRKPGMRIDIPSQVVTSSLVGWKGVNVGTLTTDGLAIIIGTDTALAATPWSANTLRFIGNGSGFASTMGLMDQVWRYGGQMMMKIEYPAGAAPDPTTKIRAAFVQPKIGSDPIIYRVSHQILGVNSSVGLAPLAGAKLKNCVDIWGGQVTIKTPNLGAGWDATDEWGDLPQTLAMDTAIPGIPRIVIYNEGSGLIPAGTKITLDLGAYMPTTEQYKAYWPETPFGILIGDGIQSVRQVPYNLGGPWKTPYSFRSGDANGVEIALTRVDFDDYPFPPVMANLPVTVWANGTTLNGSYS